MAMITYIPQMVIAATTTTADSSVAISTFFDGVVWVFKKVVGFMAACGNELDGIFVVVAIIGVFLIMADFRAIGTKFTSGSILGYIVCKVVDLLC